MDSDQIIVETRQIGYNAHDKIHSCNLKGFMRQAILILCSFFKYFSLFMKIFTKQSKISKGDEAHAKNQNFKKLVYGLFFLSIILELFHFIIPHRSFQQGDLIGNILGVVVAYLLKAIDNIKFSIRVIIIA